MYALSSIKFTASLAAILILNGTVWAQEKYQIRTTIFGEEDVGDSSVNALSGKGTIAGGQVNRNAALWPVTYGHWASQINPSTGYTINAVSDDATTYGGQSIDDTAVIWTSLNGSWSTKKLSSFEDSSYSEVSALSGDGTIAGGSSNDDMDDDIYDRAVIWTFSNGSWSNPRDLMPINDLKHAAVNALSKDGTIAGGYTLNSESEYVATLWITKDRWKTIDSTKYLGTLNNDDEALVNALSRDGQTAGGWSGGESRSEIHHAAIWTTTNNWNTVDTKKGLGTLRKDNSGNSEVRALSADGSIASGWADSDNGNHHAVLWSGSEWSIKTDLNPDSSSSSQVNSLSDDGRIAGGYVSKNGNERATLWRLDYPLAEFSNGITHPVVIARIDVANTRVSVAKLARNRFATIEQQRLSLGHLEIGCTIARAGKSCYRLGGGASGFDGATDVYTGVSFGHAFSDNFASGITIANTFSGLGNLPGDLKRDGINPGVGLWAKWRKATQGGHWYLRGAAAANRAKIKRSRSGFNDTEPGTGMSTSTGWSVATELGRVHEITRKIDVGYYGGLRHSNVRLSGYSETRAPGFPFSWSGATSSRTAAYVGARYRMSFNKTLYWSISGAHYRISFDKEAFSWAIRTELAHDLDHKDPVLTADADGGMHQAYKSDLAHTRGVLATEFSYAFNDAAVLSLSPFLEHSATDQTVYGAMLQISGDF